MRNECRDETTAADTVLTGGRVHTVDAADRVREALAIRDGRIARVGTADEVAPLIGRTTRVVDLAGASVLPGINDSHLHGVWLGAMWPRLLMDQLTAPGHGTPEPGPAGHATAGHGAMEHGAAGPSRLEGSAERRAAILRTQELLASLGVTSYTEPGLGPGEDAGASGCFSSGALRDYADLAAEGLLTARVTALMLFGELDGPSTLDALLDGLRSFKPPRDVPGWFRVAGVKIFADGIPPMGTAWTDEPYSDGTGHGSLLVAPLDAPGPGYGTGERRSAGALGESAGDGEADRRGKAFSLMVRAAHAAGYQVGVHATGGRATRAAVEAMRAAMAADGRWGARHYVIHGDVLRPGTLAAMAEAGIGLNTQAGIAVATEDMLVGALGERVLPDAWPVRDALAARAVLCLSSDAPVLSPDWRAGLAAAVTRKGADGRVRGPAQRLSVAQALRAYTIAPAWQDGAEAWKGSLEEGKTADLCVLGGDLLDTEPDAIPQLPIQMTMIGGRVIHES